MFKEACILLPGYTPEDLKQTQLLLDKDAIVYVYLNRDQDLGLYYELFNNHKIIYRYYVNSGQGSVPVISPNYPSRLTSPEPKFSLILPTRERISKMNRFLQSAITHTGDPKNIEILVAYDNDDPTTKAFLINEQNKCPIPISLYECARTTNFSRDYYNFLASQSRGKFIWAMNDDVIFETKNWETILDAHVEQFLSTRPKRLAYIGVKDDVGCDWAHKSGYTCFPMLTRETVKVMKCFFPETAPIWSADRFLYLMFEHWDASLICSAQQQVRIKHLCYHNGSETRDHVSEQVEALAIQNPAYQWIVVKQLEALAAMMDEHLERPHVWVQMSKEFTEPPKPKPQPTVQKSNLPAPIQTVRKSPPKSPVMMRHNKIRLNLRNMKRK